MAKNKAIAAPKMGNQYRKKLTTVELRQQAYDSYCDHIATGNDRRAWVFEHPDIDLTYETIESYIRKDAELGESREFNPLKKKRAESKALAYWENEGKKLMQGSYRYGSPLVWSNFMRNKFRHLGWDVDTTAQQQKNQCAFNRYADSLESDKEPKDK